jgi:two-component system phosphate regulon response regulator PhoB/two-component system alkaline phosphatase synthesis response regulator PhoP
VAGKNQRRRILVVNDNQEILDLMRDLLEEEGHEVMLHSYAIKDLDQIKRMRPDLIVLDFIIEGENAGWSLLQKLKLDPETACIPVVVCTAAARTVRDLEGHLKAKGVSVILKPFDIDDLLREITSQWEHLQKDAERTAADGS